MNVYAVVVTYNRKALLNDCLDALLHQTYGIERIILIDNASTDGTKQMLQERGYFDFPQFDYHLMPENLGGAGGFHEGIRIAHESNADWIWVMDDDVIPELDSLECMIKRIDQDNTASFFASCVKGISDEPMNVPTIDNTPTKNGYSDWYMLLKNGLVKIKTATFVSILLNGRAVEICGLPCQEFFIWGDDTEYTMRLTRYFGSAYMVGDSWVLHKRMNAKALDVCQENHPERLKNYHYFYRNSLIITALYKSKRELCFSLLHTQFSAFRYLFSGKHGGKRFAAVERGIFEFFLQYRQFADSIHGRIRNDGISGKAK